MVLTNNTKRCYNMVINFILEEKDYENYKIYFDYNVSMYALLFTVCV